MLVFSSAQTNHAPFTSHAPKDNNPMKQQQQPRKRRHGSILHALIRSFLHPPPAPEISSDDDSQTPKQNPKQAQPQHVEEDPSPAPPLPSPPPPPPEMPQQSPALPDQQPGDAEEVTSCGGIGIHARPQPVTTLEAQQRAAVKRLLFGSGTEEDRAAAAVEVGEIASGGGHQARKSLAALGVIPCLVDMLGCKGPAVASAAARALVQLADGTYSNKVAMVEAGVVPKLTRTLESQHYRHLDGADLMALLPTITSLAKASQLAHHLPQSSCAKLLPVILRAISTSTDDTTTTRPALSALLNLSSHLPNARPIVAAGFVPPLLRICADDEVRGSTDYDCHSSSSPPHLAALATLGNLVTTPEGRAAVEAEDALVPACFVRLLKSSAADGECQDRAARVLVALVRGSGPRQRRRMVEAGVVKVLVEVTLLSESAAARRTAAEMIRWFKGPEYCTWVPVARPLKDRCRSSYGSSSTGSSFVDERDDADGGDGTVLTTSGRERATAGTTPAAGQHHRNEVRRMVRQSLDRNMESIVRRAATGSISSSATSCTARSSSGLAQISRHHESSSAKQDIIKDSMGTVSFKSLSF